MKGSHFALRDSGVFGNEVREVPLLVYFDIGRVCSCSVICTDNRRRQMVGTVDVRGTLKSLADYGVETFIFRGDYFYRQDDIFKISMHAADLHLNAYFFVNGNLVRLIDGGKENGRRFIEFQTENYIEKRSSLLGDICGAGKLFCYINSCGSVSPCPNLPFRGGNVKEDDFLDIWKNDPSMNRFRNCLNCPPICESCGLYI